MPRDKEFERFNGGRYGPDYVEVPVSSKVLEEKHWSITLYGDRPFDVICIDRLPKKPNQAVIPVEPKEKTATILIKKYPVLPTGIVAAAERFIPMWIQRINTVRIDRQKRDIRPDLQRLIREIGAPPRVGLTVKEFVDDAVAEARFTLDCLASEGYVRITETAALGKRWWRAGELNPRPLRCERSALPTELAPHSTIVQPVRRAPHKLRRIIHKRLLSL